MQKVWPNGEPSNIDAVTVNVYAGAKKISNDASVAEAPDELVLVDTVVIHKSQGWKAAMPVIATDDDENYQLSYYITESPVSGYGSSIVAYDTTTKAENGVAGVAKSVCDDSSIVLKYEAGQDVNLDDYDSYVTTVYPVTLGGTYEVCNTPAVYLPSTGGCGEGVPVAAGCVLVAISLCALRRRNCRPRPAHTD